MDSIFPAPQRVVRERRILPIAGLDGDWLAATVGEFPTEVVTVLSITKAVGIRWGCLIQNQETVR